MKARAQAGFTLIEVMFAIAILSMAMTVVFSSNIIAARSTMHSRALTRATMMARCRLTEAEAWLALDRLPATDTTLEDPPTTGDDPCCTDGVTCTAQVDRIELPSPGTVSTAAGNQILGQAASAASGASFGGSTGVRAAGDGGTALGGLAGAMGMMAGAGAGGGSGGGAPSGAPSPRDMAGTLLTTVYPTVKPMLEGAIRRLTVTVSWHEGEREHTFTIVEYVTNPGQTLPSAELLNALPGGVPSGAPPTSTNIGIPPTLRSP